jgi:hypothetical protein
MRIPIETWALRNELAASTTARIFIVIQYPSLAGWNVSKNFEQDAFQPLVGLLGEKNVSVGHSSSEIMTYNL